MSENDQNAPPPTKSEEITNATPIKLERSPSLHLICNTAKGRGVFASHAIPSGTIIDTCPVLVLDPLENKEHIEKTSLYHYTYNWPSGGATQAVVFGLGSMFNHSTHHQNVGWRRDIPNQLVIYRALRDIAAGEELCISYGDKLTFEDVDGVEGESVLETADEVLNKIQLET